MIRFCRHPATFKLCISKVQAFGNIELSPMKMSDDLFELIRKRLSNNFELINQIAIKMALKFLGAEEFSSQHYILFSIEFRKWFIT